MIKRILKIFKYSGVFIFYLAIIFLLLKWRGIGTLIVLSASLISLYFSARIIEVVLSKKDKLSSLKIGCYLICGMWIALFCLKFMYWWPWFYLQFLAYLLTLSFFFLLVHRIRTMDNIWVDFKVDNSVWPIVIICFLGCQIPYSNLIYIGEIYSDARGNDVKHSDSRCETYLRYTAQLRNEQRVEKLKSAEIELAKFCSPQQ